MARRALPDGFDHKLREIAAMSDDIRSGRLSAEQEHRASLEISCLARRMACFGQDNRPEPTEWR